MKKTALFAIITTFICLGACNRDIDEFRFTGKVVGGELCSSSQIGYIIDLITPDSIGKAYTNSNGSYKNAVMAYRASRILHEGDTIYGVAYTTESYAALNCFGIIDNNLPEVILLSVDEEPEE